jgi:DNA-binding transcriptional LysR family regulator
MYDLRRLRAFYEVAERGSFVAAALELGYAQSVVSHHVSALEAELGLTLVDRSSRPVRLTPAGERARHHAVEVLGRVAEAEAELRALAGVETGALRLGAFLSAWTSFVPAALAQFARLHPVALTLERVEPGDVRRRLRAGDLDLGVVYVHGAEPELPDAGDGFAWSRLGDDPFRLVLPAAHPLARKQRIRVSDLKGERFSAPPREGEGLAYHAMLERICSDGGFMPNVAYTVPDVNISREFVSAGLCVSVMAELTIPRARPGIVVRHLPGPRKPQRTIFAVWLRKRHVPANAPMLELLTTAASDRLGTFRQ